MDPVTLATFLIGYAGQWFKSHPKIPAWAPQAVMLAIGFGCYFLSHPLVHEYAYWRDGILFSFGLPGISSVSASTGLAPKTT